MTKPYCTDCERGTIINQDSRCTTCGGGRVITGQSAVEWLRNMSERRYTLLSVDSELVRMAMAHVAELEEALSGKTMHDARNEALEDAAKEADNGVNVTCCGRPHIEFDEMGNPVGYAECCGNPVADSPKYPHEIAAAIRALKT